MFKEEVFWKTLWIQSCHQLLSDQEREVGGDVWRLKLSCLQRESLEVQAGGCAGGRGEGQGGESGDQAGEDQHQETRGETVLSVRAWHFSPLI